MTSFTPCKPKRTSTIRKLLPSIHPPPNRTIIIRKLRFSIGTHRRNEQTARRNETSRAQLYPKRHESSLARLFELPRNPRHEPKLRMHDAHVVEPNSLQRHLVNYHSDGRVTSTVLIATPFLQIAKKKIFFSVYSASYHPAAHDVYPTPQHPTRPVPVRPLARAQPDKRAPADSARDGGPDIPRHLRRADDRLRQGVRHEGEEVRPRYGCLPPFFLAVRGRAADLRMTDSRGQCRGWMRRARCTTST